MHISNSYRELCKMAVCFAESFTVNIKDANIRRITYKVILEDFLRKNTAPVVTLDEEDSDDDIDVDGIEWMFAEG
jgi:hypothetical protein